MPRMLAVMVCTHPPPRTPCIVARGPSPAKMDLWHSVGGIATFPRVDRSSDVALQEGAEDRLDVVQVWGGDRPRLDDDNHRKILGIQAFKQI